MMAASSYLTFGCEPGLHGNSVYLTTGDEDFICSAATTGTIGRKGKVTSPGGEIHDAKEHFKYLNMRGDTSSEGYHYSIAGRKFSPSSGAFTPAAGFTYEQGISHKSTLLAEVIEEEDEGTMKYIHSIYALPKLNNNYGIVDDNPLNGGETKELLSTAFHMQKKEQTVASTDKGFMADLDVGTAVETDASPEISHPQVRMPVESSYISIPNMHCYMTHHQEQPKLKIRPPMIEKYVIETAKTESEQTECGMTAGMKSVKEVQQQQQHHQADFTPENASDTETARNFSFRIPVSEYAFDINEEDRDSCAAEVDTDVQEPTGDTLMLPSEHYIESYYNANDLHQWNIY